jgi:hypothetical protein
MTVAQAVDKAVRWQGQPKQNIALSCPHPELFYGGAKGGGKSDFLLGDFYQHQFTHGRHARGILFRRSYNELEEIIFRSKMMYAGLAEYSETKKIWTFKNGAELKLRFLERDQDVGRYQGHQYSWIGFDELTEFPTDYCYVFMISCMRSAYGVPCYLRSTGNPARIGHQWVKARFISPAPPLTPIKDPLTGLIRVFVPAKLEDNIILITNDPMYENRLKALPDYMYRAFRQGDWDVVAGAALSELRVDIHMINTTSNALPNYRPERLQRFIDFDTGRPKPEVTTMRTFDWGFEKPFSVGWWFFDDEGRMYRFKEWYGCKDGRPNVGVRMLAKDIAIGIRDVEAAYGFNPDVQVADASIWDKPSNVNDKDEKLPSVAETMAEEGVTFDRELSIMAKKSRIQGKQQIHTRLRQDSQGFPALAVFDTCVDWWSTVPAVPVDPKKIEDVDTDSEDHTYDETRYGCSARPVATIFDEPPRDQHALEALYEKMERANA